MTVGKLEPCPCCGSSTHPHFASRYDGERLLWKATCANPDMLCSVQTGYYIDKESCAIIWNRRAALEAKPAATQGEVELVAYALGCSWWNRMSKRYGLPDKEKDQYIRAEGAWTKFTEDARAAIASMPNAQPVQAELTDKERWDAMTAMLSAQNFEHAVSPRERLEAALTALLERFEIRRKP